MNHSPAVLALAAVLGLAAGALIVRPLVFAFTVYEGWRRTCPRCEAPVIGGGAAAYWDLALRRRCRSCASAAASPTAAVRAGDDAVAVALSAPGPIGPAAAVPEVLTAAAVAGVVVAGAGGWLLAVQLWLAVLGSALLLIDQLEERLPHLLTGLCAAGVAVYLAVLTVTGAGWSELVLPLLGAAAIGGGLLLAERLALVGWGDVALAPSLAALLGTQGGAVLYWGVFAQIGFGIAAAGVRFLLTRDHEVALGPGLIVGSLLVSAVAA